MPVNKIGEENMVKTFGWRLYDTRSYCCHYAIETADGRTEMIEATVTAHCIEGRDDPKTGWPRAKVIGWWWFVGRPDPSDETRFGGGRTRTAADAMVSADRIVMQRSYAHAELDNAALAAGGYHG